jgi:transposase InsO family protein
MHPAPGLAKMTRWSIRARLPNHDVSAIRPGTPLSQQDAERLIQQCVDHYNNVRLHSAIGYVTPMDMLAGRQKEIQAARDRKLEKAR